MSNFKSESLFFQPNPTEISCTRRLQTKLLAVLSLLIFTVALSFTASAQTAVNFENPPYNTGTINGQDGWSSTGSAGAGSPGFDHAVTANNASAPISFGMQSLRISNGVTSPSFADQTYSKPLANEAGETSAENGAMSGGTRQTHFEQEFLIASAFPGAQQTGLSMSVAPDRGDGARMSYLRFEDQADGIHVIFDDYIDAAPFGNAITGPNDPLGCGAEDDFTDIDIATLDRTQPHTIKFVIDFVDGPRNDIVTIYIDGVLKKRGTSWEDYFRYCEGNQTRTVDSMLFRTAGPAVPANLGKGFLFDGLASNSAPSPTANVSVAPADTPTAADNDYTRINNAIQTVVSGQTIILNGTFNWTEPNAAASWAKGSDGIAGNDDDYVVLPPVNLNNVTVTASSLGAATIQGPGDLAGANLEGVFQFYPTSTRTGGDNQNWTISNIRFLDFDNAIGFYFDTGNSATSFNGTKILNNYIRIARDLNATVAPADVNQNIGIHFAHGMNQLISGNTIEIQGDGVSSGSNFASDIGMQSNTSGGNIYDGLQITNNIVRVLNAQNNANPQVVLGIWENAHGHLSNINVSGNQFLNPAAGNNPAVNLQRAFRVTSHSSATTTVTYANNRVEGANIGFQWLAGSNFAGNQPVKLTSNNILNNATGVLVQSQGLANLKFNRIVGNNTAGVNNVDGTVNAENNWWGCNYGPGAGGAGCAGTANGTLGVVDANPWLTLRTTATPNTVMQGGTSNILSNLNFNSDNVDTSGSGSIPDGTPATFTATLGTVSPTSDTTTAGVVDTTFTAGAAVGTGGAQTTIDGQTVNAPITITFTCNNVSIPTGATAATNTQFLVPINVDDTTGRNILGFDFTLTYNPAVITPIAVETAGTLSNGWTITTNNSSGTLVVGGSIGTPTPLSGSGVLVNVRFIATGGITTTSNLNLTAFQFNEGNPCVNTTNGNVTVISGTISGAVTYANAPSTTPVPNTTINAAGSIPLSTTTDANGLYSLSGFGAGAYTVTPSKTGQVNGISNSDATAVAQHVVGFITLNSTQRIAADVTGNGTISSLDASYIAQYVAGFSPPGFTGTWRFVPASRSYPNVQANQTNQDYSAILMGEVTGNWSPAIARSVSLELERSEQQKLKEQPDQVVTVTAMPRTAAAGTNFEVELTASNTTGEGIFGYEFNLLYNENVIVPQVIPCNTAGTISSGRATSCNPNIPGLLRVVVFSTTGTPISGSGTLLKLNFNSVGAVGNISPLTFQNFMFNEGVPADITVNGQVLIVGPTAASVSLGGKLMTAMGRGVANARVTLTDMTGESRTALSNSSGFYRFENVEVGQTYTVSVVSKRYTFSPQAVSIVDNLTNFDLIAEP